MGCGITVTDAAFECLMDTQVSIGKLQQGQNPVTGDIETVWVTRYEAKARRRTLRGLQRFTADTSQVFATDRFYMPTHDLNGNEMELDETLEIVEAVPFDYGSQKDLPRYRIRLVSKPANHHYEVDALRIGPGGS